MKQLHIKFSDDEWKILNDTYERMKNELEDALLHKVTLTWTIKDAIFTSYLIHVDKKYNLIPKPKKEESKEKPAEEKTSQEKQKVTLKTYKMPSGATMTFKVKT